MALLLSAVTTDITTSVNKVLASCWGVGRGGSMTAIYLADDIISTTRLPPLLVVSCTWGPVLTMPDDDIISQDSL